MRGDLVQLLRLLTALEAKHTDEQHYSLPLIGIRPETEIEVDDEGGQRRLDGELESTIYRVVQEALTNVSRHAKATTAVIRIAEQNGVLSASVTDNGQGLPDSGRLGPHGDGLEGGFGMSGMRERAELVGGELEMTSAGAGKGTTVRLTVPLSGRPVSEHQSSPV